MHYYIDKEKNYINNANEIYQIHKKLCKKLI